VTLLRAPDAGESAEALHVLGLALYQAERLEEAVAVLERAAQGQQAESPVRMLLERARRRLKAR
jgi:Flp pilus assembly protein TadD